MTCIIENSGSGKNIAHKSRGEGNLGRAHKRWHNVWQVIVTVDDDDDGGGLLFRTMSRFEKIYKIKFEFQGGTLPQVSNLLEIHSVILTETAL
jgi:hypothetical protein